MQFLSNGVFQGAHKMYFCLKRTLCGVFNDIISILVRRRYIFNMFQDVHK